MLAAGINQIAEGRSISLDILNILIPVPIVWIFFLLPFARFYRIRS